MAVSDVLRTADRLYYTSLDPFVGANLAHSMSSENGGGMMSETLRYLGKW